jgi:hypothetical protein
MFQKKFQKNRKNAGKVIDHKAHSKTLNIFLIHDFILTAVGLCAVQSGRIFFSTSLPEPLLETRYLKSLRQPTFHQIFCLYPKCPKACGRMMR